MSSTLYSHLQTRKWNKAVQRPQVRTRSSLMAGVGDLTYANPGLMPDSVPMSLLCIQIHATCKKLGRADERLWGLRLSSSLSNSCLCSHRETEEQLGVRRAVMEPGKLNQTFLLPFRKPCHLSSIKIATAFIINSG